MLEPSRHPTLNTERLILREIIPEDAPALFAFRSDPEVQRFNGGSETLKESHELIARMATGYKERTMLEWGVTLEDDVVIGLFGFANWSEVHRRAEIGFSLNRLHWRKGIALEALTAIVAFGFQQMDLNRIHAVTWNENLASVCLLERLGFLKEGVLREEYFQDGAFHDEAIYGLLRQDYASRS